MNAEQKLQARNLFFQTDLTKSQIADLLHVSRRSITYWIKEGDWNRLKASARNLPSILAENVYHIIGQFTQTLLSEQRLTNPVSLKEAEILHKLTVTVNKLKNRSTVNESMEMFGFFLEELRRKDPAMAAGLVPHVDEYITSRSAVRIADVAPDSFSGIGGRIPWLPEDTTEQQLDNREAFFSDPETIQLYADNGIPFPTDEEICTLPPDEPAASGHFPTDSDENDPALQQHNTNNPEEEHKTPPLQQLKHECRVHARRLSMLPCSGLHFIGVIRPDHSEDQTGTCAAIAQEMRKNYPQIILQNAENHKNGCNLPHLKKLLENCAMLGQEITPMYITR